MPSCRWTQPPVTSDRALDFRALLPAPSAVSVENGLGLDRSAPLLGLSSSGFSPRATWERLHVPSALDLDQEEPLPADPRRLAVAWIGLPGFRLPTRSSFLA